MVLFMDVLMSVFFKQGKFSVKGSVSVTSMARRGVGICKLRLATLEGCSP